MASYTIKLSDCIENWAGNGYAFNVRDRIELGRQKLFDFEYPIFDPDYKKVFETNFIRKFYMREIGFETEGLFKFQLETWLLINMPYFNKMFESELINFDPLVNSNMKTTSTKNKDKEEKGNNTTNGDKTRTNNQSITGSENGSSFNRNLESETPDSRLTITTQDGAGVIEYASLINEETNKRDSSTINSIDGSNTDKSTITEDRTNNITDLESYVSSKTGKTGPDSYSKMLMEYRSSLVRIENKMFDEMQQLFMLVY
jgi:hypothetical protein